MMSFLLALVYAVTCLFLLWMMVANRGLVATQFGVLGLFSLGYYPLPVLFQPLSSLSGIDDLRVFAALLIHWLFLVSILMGAVFSIGMRGWVRPLSFGPLDSLCQRYQVVLCLGAFAVYVIHAAINTQTSYAAEDFEAFFDPKSTGVAVLSVIASMCVAFIALSCASATASGAKTRILLYGAMIGGIVLLALPLGQRLAILTPIIILFAAMASFKQTGKALRLLAAAVLILAITSPFAVYLRETRRTLNGDFLSASEVASKYQLSDNPLLQSFQSLVDRSDLVYNTVHMKDYIDQTEYVGWQFYESVLVSPIPRAVFPEKPYVLSSNGKMDGEISVLSWEVMLGGLGSLTAFGGLTAYREGGWLAVLIDGLAAGAFFVFIARWLGEGGIIARIFYVDFFLNFFVAKAPASFFEALAVVLGQASVIAILFVLSKMTLAIGQRQLSGIRL